VTELVVDRPMREHHRNDQAAGLRRLFATRAARLLPMFTAGVAGGEKRWIAQLGEAFARSGQRTLLVDAARAQIAAVFGLRARFDLIHALDGDCSLAEVKLDAAPGLTVVPAARACERASAAGTRLPSLLAPVVGGAVDVVLLLLPAAGARLVPQGDALVPVLPTRESVTAAATLITTAAGQQGTLTFRLLFLGMDTAAATTLGKRMAESSGVRSKASLRHGAVAPEPRDLARVVTAAGEFALSLIAPAQQTGSGEKR